MRNAYQAQIQSDRTIYNEISDMDSLNTTETFATYVEESLKSKSAPRTSAREHTTYCETASDRELLHLMYEAVRIAQRSSE